MPAPRHTRRTRQAGVVRRPLLLLSAAVLVAVPACSDDDDDPAVSNVIPSNNETVSSGLPTTDGSPMTTPVPNANAGGGSVPSAP